jgi:hypothetical protein
MGVDVLCSLKCATFLKKTSESNRTERVRLRRGQTSGPKGSGKAQKWTAVLRYIKGVERSRYAESMMAGVSGEVVVGIMADQFRLKPLTR